MAGSAVTVAWLVADALAHRPFPALWAVGMFLGDGASLAMAYRKRRGFTLSAAGITWHAHDMFLPWSNVSEVSVRTVGSTPRLVVQLAEPDQVNDLRQRALARRNLDRYGGPIAPAVRWLGVPPEEFIAEAERFRAAPRPGLLERPAPSVLTRVSAYAAIAGVALVFFAAVTGKVYLPWGHTSHGDGVQKSGFLEFRYQARSGGGYVDQVLNIGNRNGNPVAPALAFTAQDENGDDLPSVRVRTAFGSDRGRLVVPPKSLGFDILAFSGPEADRARKVKVAVHGTVQVLAPRLPSETLRATRIDAQERVVQAGRPFTKVRVTRPMSSLAGLDAPNVQVICISWGPNRPDAPQQMLAATPITAPTSTSADETDFPLTAPAKDHTETCGSVMAVYTP
ncbi:hypothetical protein AB0L06_09760 [Spirillospora sp. NPDC052269]